MNLNLTTTLVLFGLFQSVVMIFLIFRNRNWRHTSNKLLLALLLVVGLSLIPTLLGRSGLIERNDYLRFIPFNLVIFVFPVLYLYLQSIFKNDFELNRKSSLHLILPALFSIYHIFIWLGSLTISSELKGDWVSELGYFEVQFFYNIVLLFFLCGYTMASYLTIRKNRDIPATKHNHKYRGWLIYLLVFFAVGVLFELTSSILGKIYGYWKSSPLDDWLGFSLTMAVKVYNAVLLYIISLVGYLTYSKFKQNSSIYNKTTVNKHMELITITMENEKPFLNKDFSLTTFSKKLQLSNTVLSNLLNNHLNTSFNDFTNKYRVDEVKDKLKKGSDSNFTIESIAKDAGFKSKTTFYRAFYKFTSQTPKEYILKIRNEKKVS